MKRHATRRGLRVAALCAGVAVSALALPAVGESASVKRQVLSHPGHVSTWAYLERPTAAYASPSRRSRVLGSLGLTTQDGTSELVFEQQRVLVHGAWWVQVRLPLRPRGTDRLDPAARARRAADGEHLPRRLDRADDPDAVPPREGHLQGARSAPGKPSTPTPHGQFYIRDRITGFPPDSLYGPIAFGTSALSNVETDWPGGGVIGIHGTDEPQLIPGHPSHGCIRLRNADVERLSRLLPIGTPLTIE